MLSCKQVAAIASDYLDKSSPLKWQMKMHLMMCANCRRFVKHLKITREMSTHITISETDQNAEMVWQNLQLRLKKETPSSK